jgi:hypothetical protein
MELDRFDRLLLNLMQEDSAQSAEEMAETIPLSSPKPEANRSSIKLANDEPAGRLRRPVLVEFSERPQQVVSGPADYRNELV